MHKPSQLKKIIKLHSLLMMTMKKYMKILGKDQSLRIDSKQIELF